MARSTAWLLGLGEDRHAAVGELELVHVLPGPHDAHLVGGAPPHCRRVFVWEDEVVPLLDLATWLGLSPSPERAYGAIVRYRADAGAGVRFGGLAAAAVPKRIEVDDAQACDLPFGWERWGAVAVSCFEHEGRPVPILDLAEIFSDALLDDRAGREP